MRFEGGVNTMATGVLCEVNTCKNWKNGNKCTADFIYVVNFDGKQTSEAEETGCKTFEPSTS
jgi:hypothetical protein